MMIPINQQLFSSNLIEVGTFRCPTSHPQFEHSGPIDGYTIVFPRTSVIITQEGRRPVVADPNVVMLYNNGQDYVRGQLSPRGDLCDWFDFNLNAILDTIRPFNPRIEEMWERPFPATHTPSDPNIYLLQRLVIKHLLENDEPDPLYVEETMLAVLRHIAQNLYSGLRTKKTRRKKNATHTEITNHVKHIVARDYQEKLSIEAIAAQVHCSPYHLCRVFQRQTGITIHKYLNQVRLRTSLEYLTDSSTDLTQLGLRLGYSSHSHFTQSFKQTFNTTPSTVRDHINGRHLRQMSNFLIA